MQYLCLSEKEFAKAYLSRSLWKFYFQNSYAILTDFGWLDSGLLYYLAGRKKNFKVGVASDSTKWAELKRHYFWGGGNIYYLINENPRTASTKANYAQRRHRQPTQVFMLPGASNGSATNFSRHVHLTIDNISKNVVIAPRSWGNARNKISVEARDNRSNVGSVSIAIRRRASWHGAYNLYHSIVDPDRS